MKKIYIGILLSLMIALMAGIVYGSVTCEVNVINANYDEEAEEMFYVNITWNDADNTSIDIANITVSGCALITQSNGTGHENSSAFNFSFYADSFAHALDDTICTVEATITNVSGTGRNEITCTGDTFYADTSVPISTLSTPTSGSKDVDGKATITYTCTNASSASLYLEDIGGYTSYTMTESSDVCTYNAVILTNGFHSFYAITSDGLNTTTSPVSTIEVRRPGGYIYDEQGQIMTGTAGSTVPIEGGNAVTNVVNGIMNFIFGIFDSIFSVFR